MASNKIELYFFLVLFLVALALAFFLFLPFLAPLALAAIFAVIFYPLHTRFLNSGIPSALSALLVLLILILLVLVPLSFFGYLVFQEARSLFFALSGGNTDVGGTLTMIEGYLHAYIPGFEFDLRSYAEQALGAITQSLGSVFATTVQAILSLALSLIAFYYFLKDGARFKDSLAGYSPLQNKYDDAIFERLKLTINSVIKGSLLIALLQGVMTSIGLAIFGVPNPILWGAIAGVGALIPTVGTALVIAPSIAYLLFVGSIPAAIGLALWGALAVGFIDNFLGPYFIGRDVQIHPLFILLSVLGGIGLFGPIGVILGPIVLSLLLVLAHIYASLVVHQDTAS